MRRHAVRAPVRRRAVPARCAWPAGDLGAYPRCDPGPLGLRLPADTRASAALPSACGSSSRARATWSRSRYRTETRELGYRGASAGTRFALFRDGVRVSEAEAALGDGVARLAAGRSAAAR